MTSRTKKKKIAEKKLEKQYKVTFKNNKVEKAANELPERIKESFAALLLELKKLGPTRTGWPNYGKLKGLKKGTDKRHCHLRGGSKPKYVVCWEVLKDGNEEEIDIYYVGSHEGAPYQKKGKKK